MAKQKVQNSWYCAFIIQLSHICIGVLISYNGTCFNPIQPIVQRIYNDTHFRRYGEHMSDTTWNALLSVTMSMLPAGALFGSILFKFLLKCLTKKWILILSHISNTLGAFLFIIGLKITGSYEIVIIGRFITGLTLGFGLSVIPVIENETSVPHRRNFYGGMIGISTIGGGVVGSLVAWYKVFGTYERYFGIFIVQMVPSIAYLSYAFWIVDSPFQVLSMHGKEEALKLLRKLRTSDNTGLGIELEEISEVKSEDATDKSEVLSLVEVLNIPQYRRHFFAVVLMFAYIMLSGLNSVLFYSDKIFLSAGVSEEAATPATIGVFTLGLVVTIVATVLGKYIEPKWMIQLASALMKTGHALLTASIASYIEIPSMSICAISAMCIYYTGFSLLNMAAYVVVGAISLPSTQPACTNVASGVCWFCSWFVGFTANYLQLWLGAYASLIWMGFCIFFTICVIFCIPTVKGKTTEEVQAFFKR